MDKVWKAKWIIDRRYYGHAPVNLFLKDSLVSDLGENAYPVKHSEHLKNQHMLVRKEFYSEGEADNISMDITADDYYKLYINGRYVGQGPAPSYYFHYNYNRYDISRYLKQGKNVIAVHVYYQGLINRVWNSGDYRQGMIAEVMKDGKCVLASDATWKYTVLNAFYSARTTGYETQYLEDYDSRLAKPGWTLPDYEDGDWMNCCETVTDDHKLFPQITPPLEIYEIKPLETVIVSPGHIFIDFGHEITGCLKITAKGMPGQKAEVRYAEELYGTKENDGNGIIRFDMRCNCSYREFWVLSGNEDIPEYYDYKVFRYAEVFAPENVVFIGDITGIVRHYPFDDGKCSFSSSDVQLGRIWEICREGVRYCSQEIYVDCPGREKGQYLGDVNITAQSQIYLTGDMRLFKKAVMDFAMSSAVCPGLLAVAPGGFMQEAADYSLQFINLLLTYYRHSGDLEFLKAMYPVAEGVVTYFKRYQRDDGLLENINEKQVIMDWPSNMRDEYDFPQGSPFGGCHNVINAFYFAALCAFEEISDILGYKTASNLAEFRESFVRAFYNKETGLFTDSEISSHSSLHSNILPVLYNMAPEEARDGILFFIKEKGMACGVYMSYFLMKALAAAGEYGHIYRLITSGEKHSWSNMLDEGATTCFEAWGKDLKWNTSLCHAWASAPIIILIEDIAGLTPAKPGWEAVKFSPHIPEELEDLRLEIHVKTGKIKVRIKGGKADIELPDGVSLV